MISGSVQSLQPIKEWQTYGNIPYFDLVMSIVIFYNGFIDYLAIMCPSMIIVLSISSRPRSDYFELLLLPFIDLSIYKSMFFILYLFYGIYLDSLTFTTLMDGLISYSFFLNPKKLALKLCFLVFTFNTLYIFYPLGDTLT